MKITDQHAEYAANYQRWQRCRDFISGADALRSHDLGCGGDYQLAYLPKLSTRQSAEDYEKYVRRALYDNVPRQMKNAMSGLVFSKDPEIDLSGQIKYMIKDCDLMETPLTEMVEWIFSELLNVGRCGILVDRPETPVGISLSDAERLGLRAHFVPYTAEQIINWSVGRVGSRWMVTRVVLAENADEYTELKLDEIGYNITKWRKDKNTDFQVISSVYPEMNSKPIYSIPFWFFGPANGKTAIQDPPMIDIVEDARSWYQTSGDIEHALFSCGLPTPGFYGFSDDEAVNIIMGGLNGIHSVNTEARAEFLEYKGEGTAPLERGLDRKYNLMAKHGVQLLDKADAESAETVRARIGIQTATLSDMANCTSRLMSQALTFASEWMGGGPCLLVLNTNYIAVGINPQEITALLSAVVAGALPIGDFIRKLRKGGLIEPDRTDEQISADLQLSAERDTGTLI